MDRFKQPFTLYKRGKIWYFRLADDPKRIPHSTGKTTKVEAAQYAEEVVKQGVPTPVAKMKLRDYLPEALEQYIKTRAADGNPVTDRHCRDSRRFIRYILDDEIVEMKLGDVKVSHVSDFKLRLLERMKDRRNTANRVLRTLKMLLRTAYERQEINRDPSGGSRGVRRIAVKSKTRNIYTSDQLERLFPPDSWEKGDYSPWAGIHDYTAFLLTASTGLRRKEVLGLQWSAVFLEESIPYVVVIEELAKSKKRRATPFFDQVVFGDDRCVRAMKQLRGSFSRKNTKIMTISGTPVEGYCFGYADGSPRRETWWTDRLTKALENAGIERGGDEKTLPLDGHSFRHTLASNLKSRGMPDSLIRTFCGWSGLKVQSDYTHFDPDLIQHYTQWISRQA